MNLIEALTPKLPARIAIVGGGGKTTTLFQIGQQVQGLAWTTTTTHLGTDQLGYADRHFLIESVGQLDVQELKAQKHSLITGPFTPDERVHGPEAAVLQRLVELADQEKVSLIVEADGARSRALKAPEAHEPVIPAWAEMVIVLVGCSVLGKPLNDETVHRAQIFSSLTNLEMNEPIDPAAIMRMLIHPLGGLKGIPPSATRVVLFNQADVLPDVDPLKQQIPALLAGGYDKVIIGALAKHPNDLICMSK
ncbi:MAG: selenium cofactor biosynthesis protein YqeC [Anaerolineaceae bacterium]|nr:selenium cofactor biosynthesis protein YqeC [Anaerolineaceae bacterium]